tara:strand:- start:1950 stop:4865 length:2916 start_codon:yes stop_codon:yes gene_type:complete
MSSSYRGTEFNVVGQARDTFVKPTTQAEVKKTGFDRITETLVSLNPALQKTIGLETQNKIKEEKLKGFELAVRQNREAGGFKTVVDELRRNVSEGRTRQFIGGSIFAQDAFNQSRAALLGNTIGAEISSLYQTTSVPTGLFDADGQPVLNQETGEQLTKNEPLWKFPTNSPEYKNFLANASALSSYELEGVKPEDQLKFLNKQNAAIEKTTLAHDKSHKEYNFNLITSDMNASLMTSWTLTKDTDPTTIGFQKPEDEAAALVDSYEEMNQKINRDYSIGLTSSKEKKYYESMIDNIESVALQINQEFGSEEARDFIKWTSKIRYGNGKNTLLQHKDFATKMFNLKVKIGKENDRIRENRDQRKEEAASLLIGDTLDKLLEKSSDGRINFLQPEGQQALNFLYTQLSEQKELVDNAVDLYNGDRKTALMQFRLSINSGEYDDDPEQAGTDLLLLTKQLGGFGRVTKIERGMIDKIVTDIKSIPDNQLVGGYKYYSKEIDNAIYSAFDMAIDDTGKVSFTGYDINGVNKKTGLNTNQAGKLADQVKRQMKLQFQNWKDTGDKKGRDLVEEYFDNVLMNPNNNQSIEKAISKAMYPTDIPITLFARDNSILTIKINKHNDKDLYKKFREGTNSASNPPEELFDKFKIPFKYKEPYFIDAKKPDEVDTSRTVPAGSFGIGSTTEDDQTQESKKGSVSGKLKDKKDDLQGMLPVDQRPTSTFNNIMNTITGTTPAVAGTLEDAPLTHIVQSGDNLFDIANKYNVTVDEIVKLNNIKNPELINIDERLLIPINPVNTLFDFRSSDTSKFVDYGGFARIIRNGESSNNYNAVNYGKAFGYKSGVVDGLDNTTLGNVIEDLENAKYGAAGAYQFQLEPLKESMTAAGLSPNDKFTVDVQDRLFWARMMNSIRADARAYILGKSDDLDAALLDVAQEFAAAPMANGKGYYDGDEAGNKANIDLVSLKAKLQLARKQLTDK